MFESELLAAAAVQEAMGNKEEAKRLRNEYEEGDRRPEVTTNEKIEDLKGPVTYMCKGCGAGYEEKRLQCEKCGSCAIEPVRLAAAAASPAHHQNKK